MSVICFGENKLPLARSYKFLAEVVLHGHAIEGSKLRPEPLVQVAAVRVTHATHHLYCVVSFAGEVPSRVKCKIGR